MEKRKLPRLAYNWTSAAGALIALVAGSVIIFLLGVNLIIGITNPYLGIVLYLLLPVFLVIGLILIPLGMYIKWRAWQRTGEIPAFKWPSIDLNIRRHRNAALIFILGSLLFVLVSSVGIYQAYHFTDSVAFCGTVCHKVMKPEYTAYRKSPHARVACVSCHIGPGAGWYAKSKITGLYQVYAVAADVYPRPIPTPIKDLRPARETCEECHWPSYFFGARQRQFSHYRYDEANTRWTINMLVKVGGSIPGAARASGIHWHTDKDIRIEYMPRDKKRQDIPWVRVTERLTGKSTVYQDITNPLPGTAPGGAAIRTMDCMDCHNRPSHDFHSPDYAVDNAISTGQIDRSIPEIKLTAVDAMAKEYKSEQEAESGITNSITGFYRNKYPEQYLKNVQEINNAVLATRSAYNTNVFPFMKARWAEYPNNIGHFIFRGCMRCHDGNHKSSAGEAIPNDCRTCHIILAQGNGKQPEQLDLRTGLDFRHPVDIGDAWKGGVCYECHTGVRP